MTNNWTTKRRRRVKIPRTRIEAMQKSLQQQYWNQKTMLHPKQPQLQTKSHNNTDNLSPRQVQTLLQTCETFQTQPESDPVNNQDLTQIIQHQAYPMLVAPQSFTNQGQAYTFQLQPDESQTETHTYPGHTQTHTYPGHTKPLSFASQNQAQTFTGHTQGLTFPGTSNSMGPFMTHIQPEQNLRTKNKSETIPQIDGSNDIFENHNSKNRTIGHIPPNQKSFKSPQSSKPFIPRTQPVEPCSQQRGNNFILKKFPTTNQASNKTFASSQSQEILNKQFLTKKKENNEDSKVMFQTKSNRELFGSKMKNIGGLAFELEHGSVLVISTKIIQLLPIPVVRAEMRQGH